MGLADELIAIKMRLQGAAAYQRQMQRSAASTNAFGAAVERSELAAKNLPVGLGAMMASANTGISAFGKRARAVGSHLRSVGSRVTSGVGLPLLLVAAVVGKLTVDFDKAMRNVNSIAQLPEAALDGLKSKVLDLAGETAQAPQTLAEGLYDLVSSGFSAEASLAVLAAAALAATAGLTTTDVSARAVAAVLNAYRLPASKARDVSDVLFRIVDRGVISFEELASNIGKAIPFAATSGISLRELGAGVATLTKQGQSGAEAITFLKNTIVAFNKPSEALSNAIGAAGFESGEALLKAKGFQGALEAVVGTTDGSKKALSKLFPNIRAQAAVFGLVGQNAKGANADLKGMNAAAGATSTALSQQSKSTSFKAQKAWSEMKASLIEVGLEVLPEATGLLLAVAGAIKGSITWFRKLPKPVKSTALAFAGALVLAGPTLTVGGMLATGLRGLIAAVTFLGVSGSLWVLAGIALIAAWALIIANFDTWGKYVVAFFLGPIALAAVALIDHWDGVKDAFGSAKGAVGGALSKLPGLVTVAIGKVPRALGWLAGLFLTLPIRIHIALFRLRVVAAQRVGALIGWFASLPGKLWNAIGTLASRLPGVGEEAGSNLLGGVKAKAGLVLDWFKALPGKAWGAAEDKIGMLLDVGKSLIEQLLDGFLSALPQAVKDLFGVGGEMLDDVSASPGRLGRVKRRRGDHAGSPSTGQGRRRPGDDSAGASVATPKPQRRRYVGVAPQKLETPPKRGRSGRKPRRVTAPPAEIRLFRRKFGEGMALAMKDDEENK